MCVFGSFPVSGGAGGYLGPRCPQNRLLDSKPTLAGPLWVPQQALHPIGRVSAEQPGNIDPSSQNHNTSQVWFLPLHHPWQALSTKPPGDTHTCLALPQMPHELSPQVLSQAVCPSAQKALPTRPPPGSPPARPKHHLSQESHTAHFLSLQGTQYDTKSVHPLSRPLGGCKTGLVLSGCPRLLCKQECVHRSREILL